MGIACFAKNKTTLFPQIFLFFPANSPTMFSRIVCTILCISLSVVIHAQPKEKLIYHTIKTDKSGKIVSWFDANPGKAYNHIINMVWNFWDTMRTDFNGLPYYMNPRYGTRVLTTRVEWGATSLPWPCLPGDCITLIPEMKG